MKKLRVGDRVKMTRRCLGNFQRTRFTTGIVTRVRPFGVINVKRDGYRGHECTEWLEEWWLRY